MKHFVKAALLGSAIGLTFFVMAGIIFDIVGAGTFALKDWQFTKMAIGSILVGIGFSVPALVYESEKLPYATKVLVHMGTGCTIMLVVALLVGWIPFAAGWKICALAIAAEIVVAALIWLGFSLYFKKMAKRMNQRIKEGNSR